LRVSDADVKKSAYGGFFYISVIEDKFAPLVGIIGSMQAAEALKLIAAVGASLAGRLLLLDAREMAWSSIAIHRDPRCTVCAH
jgi:molybdopterin/thiamine biosynthesis adenylyltransferase